MLEGFEDELYENGYRPERIYSSHTKDELGAAYEDSFILFETGEIQLYYGARQTLEKAGVTWQKVIIDHLQGEFGDLDDTQLALNDAAIALNTGVIISRYIFDDGFVDVQTDLEQKLTKVS